MNILREISLYFLYKLIMLKENFIKEIKKPFRKEQKYRGIYILWIIFLVIVFIGYIFTISNFFLIGAGILVVVYLELGEFIKGEWKGYFRKKAFGNYYELIKKQRKGGQPLLNQINNKAGEDEKIKL